MRVTLKASLTAIMLTSVAAIPLATATTMVTADAAFAKSDKAKGKGSGKAKSKGGTIQIIGSRGGKSKSKAKGGGGGAFGKAMARGEAELDTFFGKLTGKDKKKARTAKVSSKAKAKFAKDDPMHPSNLGNMNGALNSSPNAMLAHIRNGNYNGPVGHLAAFAVARNGAVGADGVLEVEEAYLALDEVVGEGKTYADIDAYFQSLEDAESAARDPEIEAALEAYLGNPEDEIVKAELEMALADEGYESDLVNALGDYESDVQEAVDLQTDSDVESALTFLEYDPEADVYGKERPDPEDVIGAEDAILAEGDATSAILDYWNKGDSTSEGSEELLAALQDKVDANAEAIAEAIPEEMEGEGEEEVADCELDADGCEISEEDLIAAE